MGAKCCDFALSGGIRTFRAAIGTRRNKAHEQYRGIRCSEPLEVDRSSCQESLDARVLETAPHSTGEAYQVLASP